MSVCVCYIHSIQTWVCCLSCMKNWARASSSRIRCTCHMARLSLWAASSDRRLYWSISSFLQCGCSNTRVTNKCCWIRVSSRGTCSKCIPKKGFFSHKAATDDYACRQNDHLNIRESKGMPSNAVVTSDFFGIKFATLISWDCPF